MLPYWGTVNDEWVAWHPIHQKTGKTGNGKGWNSFAKYELPLFFYLPFAHSLAGQPWKKKAVAPNKGFSPQKTVRHYWTREHFVIFKSASKSPFCEISKVSLFNYYGFISFLCLDRAHTKSKAVMVKHHLSQNFELSDRFPVLCNSSVFPAENYT